MTEVEEEEEEEESLWVLGLPAVLVAAGPEDGGWEQDRARAGRSTTGRGHITVCHRYHTTPHHISSTIAQHTTAVDTPHHTAAHTVKTVTRPTRAQTNTAL